VDDGPYTVTGMHTYTHPGTFTITLVVGDDDGDSVNFGTGSVLVVLLTSCPTETQVNAIFGGAGNYRKINTTSPDANGKFATAGNDILTGFPGTHNWIVDLRGNNTINAGPMGDIICTGPGADRVFGGTGDDLIFGGAGNDFLQGGDGVDQIFGEDGNDFI